MDAPEALSKQRETSHSGLPGDRLLDRRPPLLLRRLLPAFLPVVTHRPSSPSPTLTNLRCVQRMSASDVGGQRWCSGVGHAAQANADPGHRP
ncbi:unnamed protein product [Rangifer tarandus platyrhynchus]|uniref:Uncharacterized protein n=1 Tax=Rangifer tarandus platyrhynchus TaxID=3082113 RepID=A0AC59YJD0_RANTA